MIIKYQYLYVFIFIVFSGVFFSSKIFIFIDSSQNNSKRNISLDSLRGFLAIFVVFTHAIAMYYLFTEENWSNPNDKIGYLASVAVAIFFILTGYLFWDKIKNTKIIDWKDLFINRIFRIVPLIYFQTIISIFIILFIVSPQINLKNLEEIIITSLPWFDFINNNKPDILDFKNSYLVTGGVLWSIVYEWGFYFSLPLLFLFRNKSFVFVVTSIVLLVYCNEYFFQHRDFYFVYLFIIGLAVSEFKQYLLFNINVLNILFLISCICLLIFKPQQIINSYFGLLAFFIVITLVNGADFFSLFKLKGFERLGVISYSVYIIHPPVLFVWYYLVKKENIYLKESIFWMYIPIFLSLIISSFTYKFIEIPFINLGRSFKKYL